MRRCLEVLKPTHGLRFALQSKDQNWRARSLQGIWEWLAASEQHNWMVVVAYLKSTDKIILAMYCICFDSSHVNYQNVTSTWVQVFVPMCPFAHKIFHSHGYFEVQQDEQNIMKHHDSWHINPEVFEDAEKIYHRKNIGHNKIIMNINIMDNIFGPLDLHFSGPTWAPKKNAGPPPPWCCKSLAARHWHHVAEPQTPQN